CIEKATRDNPATSMPFPDERAHAVQQKAPPKRGFSLSAAAVPLLAAAALRQPAGGDHEVVEAVLGDLEPRYLVVAERLPRPVDLVEFCVLGGDVVVHLGRRLVARRHD